VIASRRGPSDDAASSSAWTTNQVPTRRRTRRRAGDDRRRRARLAPRKLAVTAAKMSTASSPSRKTMIAELKTTVAWLCWPRTSVGSIGPVLAVAMR
jgi:hypothetical protein